MKGGPLSAHQSTSFEWCCADGPIAARDCIKSLRKSGPIGDFGIRMKCHLCPRSNKVSFVLWTETKCYENTEKQYLKRACRSFMVMIIKGIYYCPIEVIKGLTDNISQN